MTKLLSIAWMLLQFTSIIALASVLALLAIGCVILIVVMIRAMKETRD